MSKRCKCVLEVVAHNLVHLNNTLHRSWANRSVKCRIVLKERYITGKAELQGRKEKQEKCIKAVNIKQPSSKS